MNKIDLTSRVFVITGGARGIGFAIAQDKLAEQAADSAQALGEAASAAGVHVTDEMSVASALAATLKVHGTVDGLVNCAGITGPVKPLHMYDVADWRDVVDVNLTGTFLCCKAVIPTLMAKNYGRIVNIASVAGKEGNPNLSAYSAAKAGVIALTKSLGKELAKTGIAVNCITPGTAQTPILEQLTPEFIEYMRVRIPRERFVTVDEIANMVAWLLSEENSFTTAATFDLSGGRTTY
jgi:2-dehydro-3-deoxy-L-rhamnonate dehydrogenase (NAD+)